MPVITSKLHLNDDLIKIARLLRQAANIQHWLRLFGSGAVIMKFSPIVSSIAANDVCEAFWTADAARKVAYFIYPLYNVNGPRLASVAFDGRYMGLALC